MSPGIHSTILSLQTRLFHRWCPKWYGGFEDRAGGGFYERLGKGFKPLATGQRRLLTQCRQLAIYSDSLYRNNNSLYKNLKEKFEFILKHYHDPKTGLWSFSLNDDGTVLDRTCDLYTLTFVIFACSHYFRATGDGRARETAAQVLALIETRFRLAQGFAEALGPDGRVLTLPRRQNPHMHLLEACLFARDVWDDPGYEVMADEMVFLFQNNFFDAGRCALYEFFTPDLKPDPDQADHLEPGHYFEWIWLLKKHAKVKGDPALHDPVCVQLLGWANTHGWDETYGGIYDTVAVDGRVIADTKRLWPFCEALKANVLMLDTAKDRLAIKNRVRDMTQVFRDSYMQERGFWTEWLTRDLSPATDYMPGTTPYHVYFGITEAMDILKERGPAKSWGAGLRDHLYGLRRRLSWAVKRR